MPTHTLDRRRFVWLASGGAFAACLPGCATLAATTVRGEGGAVTLRLSEHPQLRDPFGSLRMRTEGTQQLFYVLRQEDGAYIALSPICTHQGCTVQLVGRLLECPCHGSVYTREGEVVRGPAERPLRRLPVRTSADGDLIVQTGERS